MIFKYRIKYKYIIINNISCKLYYNKNRIMNKFICPIYFYENKIFLSLNNEYIYIKLFPFI
jgi:hypothetical protein